MRNATPVPGSMDKRTEERFKTVLQVIAIALLAAIVGVILHKAHGDVAALARDTAGGDFWKALARQLLRNLAGG
jgi:hypothetical protein